MAKTNKTDQTTNACELGLNRPAKLRPDNELYDSHIIQELVKYVDGKPERLQYLRQCIIPFFDMVFFAENVEGGDRLIKEIVLKEEPDHV